MPGAAEKSDPLADFASCYLTDLDYVESDGKHFWLTPHILELGFAYPSSLPVWHLAEPVRQALFKQVKESCSAAVLYGSDIVYMLRVHTYKIMSINLGTGSRLPAYCTSIGRVLLTAMPDAELRRHLSAHPLPARTQHPLTDVDRLMEQIRQVRMQGWCLVDQELEEGPISMAAPVVDAAGKTGAALNISDQANRTGAEAMQETMLPALREAALAISSLLRSNGAH